ncbi:MAG: hypothetical protein ACK5L3_02160 [Oscillospiraceae bacterium]
MGSLIPGLIIAHYCAVSQALKGAAKMQKTVVKHAQIGYNFMENYSKIAIFFGGLPGPCAAFCGIAAALAAGTR